MTIKQMYTCFSGMGPRENNEDCFNIVTVSEFARTLYIVCDGMGGHARGEIASQTVCRSISSYWERNPKCCDSEKKVIDAMQQACIELDNRSIGYEMGTTMVMVSIEDSKTMIAHCGDSRCYVVDIKGNVKYRSIDHVDNYGYVTKCFFTGHMGLAVPDVKIIQLEPLDRILLCTDGLYNTIDDETLLHTLHCARDVKQVEKKYETICQENANDNYTGIIIEIG